MSIVIDGETVFAHKEPLSVELKQSADEERKQLELNNEYYAFYDLEDYTLPALIRKLLKTTKKHEIRSVRCTRKDKLTDHLDDPNGVFTLERLDKMQQEAIITFALVDYEEKEYPFKVSNFKVKLLVACG